MAKPDTFRRTKSNRFSRLPSMMGILLATSVLLSIFIASQLFGSKDDGNEQLKPARRILTVATLPVNKQTSYQVERSYLGTVEPRRMSRIGFEVPGKLSQLYAEEGQMVEQGQLLAELDVERLEAAKNEAGVQLIEAEAALSLAKATLKRTTGAQKLKAVSNQQLDEAEAGVKQQQARHARVQAQIERIDVDIKKAKLLAPYRGMLAVRLSDEGVVLTAGQPVFEIRETSSPEIHIGVNRDQLNQLSPGTVVTGTSRGQAFEMDIDRVLPGRQDLTRVVEVIAVPRDRTIPLREGDLVEVTICEQINHPGFWLPVAALTENGHGLWSCLIAEPLSPDEKKQSWTHRLSRRDLEIISLEGARVFVTGNFTANVSVVVEGLHRVVPNQRIRITKSKQFSEANLALLKN